MHVEVVVGGASVGVGDGDDGDDGCAGWMGSGGLSSNLPVRC